jgi:hypothetical protein
MAGGGREQEDGVTTFPLHGALRLGTQQPAAFCSDCQRPIEELTLNGDELKHWEVDCIGDGAHVVREARDAR